MLKIHLDTDIGGDMDDLCALAMLLKWSNLDITGVTTVSEENGRRAGYVRYVLNMMGRTDIPYAAGADVSGGYYRYFLGYPPDEDNWPEPITYQPGSHDAALTLLKRSIEAGAIIVGTGPFTNFRLLDEKYPGLLKQAKLYLMGGYVYAIPPGYPAWENEYDYNIQVDAGSGYYVLTHAEPTLIPLTISCRTALRRAYLPRLAKAGRLGQLIIRQAELFAKMDGYEQKYGETCARLPNDLINFQHDPLACAIALRWREGVEIETVPLKIELRDGYVHETPDPNGKPMRVVTNVNAEAFNEYWCDVMCS